MLNFYLTILGGKIIDKVFNYLDKRVLSFYNEAMMIKRGVFPNPRFMILYPTNVCPFNCTFCDYAELNAMEKKTLKPSEWEYILNEFKNNGGMAVELCGGGEPLATPGVDELIRYAAKLGLKVGVMTNGLFIDAKKYPKIYDALLDCASYVRVSMESGSQEVFDKVRQTTKFSFNDIIDNVSELIQDKSDELQVSYKYTIGSHWNYRDVYRAIRIAEVYKFDSIQFKPACNVNDAFKENRNTVELDIKYYAESYLTNTTLVCNLSDETLDTDCFMSAVHTVIDYNGDMFICCYYRHRIPEHRLGNIFDEPFWNIWYSHRRWEKIKEIDVNKCNLYDCRFIRYNKIMNHAIETGQLEFI